MSEDRVEVEADEGLMARIAWLYYNDGLTQSELGEMFNLSRVKVSRLLEAGRAAGLIQVRINSRHHAAIEAERRLRERFALADCRVIPDGPGTPVAERLGEAAAQYLMEKLRPDQLLAVGWGETVSASIRKLGYVAQERGVGVVSLTGGVRTYVEGMRRANWDHTVSIIPAPLIVGSPALAAALMAEPSVSALMDMAIDADFKLVGIGAIDERATVVTHGFIPPTDIEPMRRRGAVGDILCRFFDREGAVLDLPLHDRVVGVNLDRLRGASRVIGAAGGRSKVPAIRAALTGGIVDILITDETTARTLLAGEEAP
jgi:lsr operon transcriptional repressor